MDPDLAFSINESPKLTKSSTQAEKTSYDPYKRSYHLILMFIKSYIIKSIRDSIPNCAKVVDYLKAI